MGIKSGIDARVTFEGNNFDGLQDAGMTRERVELVSTTVGDTGVQREIGIKDAQLSFSGVVDSASTALKELLDAARDGTEAEVKYTHDTNTAPNKTHVISATIVTSVSISSGVEQLVDFSAEVMGTDTTNGWTSE